MSVVNLNRAGLALAALTLMLPALPAHAQTAADINRANAALQICNSPMGAGLAECAQLRGMVGQSAAPAGGNGAAGILGALGQVKGGNKAAGVAGLLGSLGAKAAPAAAAPAPSTGPANAAAIQQAYALCIQNAGVNAPAIQACGTQLQLAMGAANTAPALQGQAVAPGDYSMATYGAAQNYQACVAANPNNWQACLAQMNGAAAAPATPAAPAQNGAANAAAAASAIGGFLRGFGR